MTAESLVASYTAIFGDLMDLDAREQADRQSRSARYYGWSERLSALGLPDYTRDLPRVTQTNTIMVGAFEQIASTLCDRAALRDLVPTRASVKAIAPEQQALAYVDAQRVFDFEPKLAPLAESDFGPRFDVLHRTFLGYPAGLGPPERTHEFFVLYKDVEQRHGAANRGHMPHVVAWSAVCQALTRHPEFHHY
jgi:hypothetical protein